MKIIIIFTSLILCVTFVNAQRVIIDSDTGNEIDDVPAIALALLGNKLDVIGITATQWNRVEVCGRNTMMESWKLNNRILEYLNLNKIPSLKGAEEMVGKQWAIQPPRKSEATDFIIKHALSQKPGEKLTIIVTGAATNVASAVMLEPAIVEKVSVFFIGTNYVFERNAISKNEFNVRNDLNAFDVLLNTKNLELHIMPANVTKDLVFFKEEIYALKGKNELSDLIIERWDKVARDFNEWIMWDVAIIQAVSHPEWVKEILHDTPDENTPRKIHLYTKIDNKKMKEDFWEVINRE